MAKVNHPKMIALSGYQITDWLGKGSYSEVYEGIQKVSGEKVAVKVINKGNLTKGKVDDIVSEIGIMKSLNHPNIVQMVDFKWDEKNVYIVLEYCEGGNLLQYIKRLIRLPEAVCKRATQQLAMGLAYLRLKEICHMDLKPQNLLIKYKPFTLKIADFGLSQHLSEEAYAENIRGSPLYMAPEILLKKKYNYKVDLWSVGVILYECLFGKTPFSNRNCRQLIDAFVLKVPIKYPTTVAVSEDGMSLLHGLLKYEPHERMNFDDFFNHSFVDLIHAPTEENKKLAIHIIHEAVKYDEQKKYAEAFSAYCRALRYMVPILHSLKDSNEWDKIHLKVMQCLTRAEELKVALGQYDSQKNIENYWESDLNSVPKEMENMWKKTFIHKGEKNTEFNPLVDECKPSSSKLSLTETSGLSFDSDMHFDLQSPFSKFSFKESKTTTSLSTVDSEQSSEQQSLKSLFQSTPKVYDALEIGSTGQMYMAEGDYEQAYKKFEASLSILIPHLKKELPSGRRDILVRQVQWWLTQAESAKALAAAREINEEMNMKHKILETTENCSVQ